MGSTHIKGILGEMSFAQRLLECGYNVLHPMNPNSPYDLVAEKEDKFIRIQVKYCTPRDGKLRVEMRRPRKKELKYQKRGIDAMGIFNSSNKSCYLIPMQVIASRTDFLLRITKPLNNQKRNIHYAESFLLGNGM